MTKAPVPDKIFIETWLKFNGQTTQIAKALDLTVSNTFHRRKAIEGRLGVLLPSGPNSTTGRPKEYVDRIGQRIELAIKDGIAVVWGDSHYWPGEAPVAHKALICFINVYQPQYLIFNGDALDGPTISRHPPKGWSKLPDVADELAFCKEMMGEIAAAAPPKAKLCWNMGNHDARFSARLASVAPEYVRVEGMDLQDHFPAWNFAWSTHINDDVVVKHRFRNGLHAAWNNTLHGGKTIVTNHLHRSCVTPITDYRGRRWGVDTGTLSDFGPETDKFDYGEDNPMNWGSGFGSLTFKAGRLLPPELVTVQDGIPYFRGESLFMDRARAQPTVNKSAKV
jgi:hypothetical protein